MRLLLYTNLFPSADMPRHGIFVEERLRHLVATGQVTAEVCALRPRNKLLPKPTINAGKPNRTEERHGVRVTYVDVPTLPLITNWIDPLLWSRASKNVVQELAGDARTDLVLEAHFLYPDAVAAVILARRLGVPVVMTARGSDVNIKCENLVMRSWIRWAARRADAVVTVSQALADKLAGIGVPADKLHALPNGVDLEKFRPVGDARSRANVESPGMVLLSVGHLLEAKGHQFAIEALASLPDATLLIVGQGPQENALRQLAKKLGVETRVRILGHVPQDQLADFYSAADYTILASENEGMPNVMLESLACGTRVIATDVGGVSEVITSPVAGAMMAGRSAAAIDQSIKALAAMPSARNETRAFAETLGWSETVRKQLSLYERVVPQ